MGDSCTYMSKLHLVVVENRRTLHAWTDNDLGTLPGGWTIVSMYLSRSVPLSTTNKEFRRCEISSSLLFGRNENPKYF